MVIFPAKKQEEQLLEERIRELFKSSLPELVWVDNLPENYRFWGVYPLFAQNGRLLKDAILPLGAYGLILPKGSRIEADSGATEWTVSGALSFRYTGAAAFVEKLTIDQEGVLSFLFSGELLGAAFGTGIRYVLSSYDERVERTVFKTLYSEVFDWKEVPEVKACFFPAAVPKNRWELLKEVNVQTVLQTVYLQKVRLCLPKGFGFQLAAGADINGYEEEYFTPSGNAKILESGFFMPGLTGSEMIEMGKELCFCPGGKAYFEDLKIQGKPDTAYVSFSEAVYYTQPEHMNFYNIREEGIYEYAVLPGVPLGERGLPVFPFGGLRENSKEAVKLEELYLSGMRKSLVEEQIEEKTLYSESISYAITRNGMKAAYNSQKLLWLQTVPLKELMPGIAYTSMSSRFWFALLSARLFLVLTSLGDMASVPYSVTVRRLQLAKAYGYQDGEKLSSLCGKTFYTEEELKMAVEGCHADWEPAIKEACCHFNQNLAGWEFQCSPGLWEKYKTLAVLKLVDNRSMNECMKEVSLWSLKLEKEEKEKAEQYYGETAALLNKPELQNLGEILENKEWKGSVFFRAGVDVSGLPKELEFLTKGIDQQKFFAAYAAFPAVSISCNEKSLGSALIYYEDPGKLNFEEYEDFGFRVRQLELDIREDKIYGFQARTELLINKLFGHRTAGRKDEESCSLVFHGSYQESENGGYYAFVMEEPVEYILDNCGISSILIETAFLRTEGESSRFVLGGTVSLLEQEDTDLLSFEKLPFEGLLIEMRALETGYEFQVDYGSLLFHPEGGLLREGSFGAMFPAKINRLLIQENKRVVDLGFETLKIKGFGDDEALGRNWMGFLWLIETGNLGGLAAKTNLTLELLTAFSPDSENPMGLPHFYCGLRIKSLVKTDTFALPLQGIMSLGFDSMELKKGEDFYFRFRNFSLTILGKRFPESNNDLYLIADEEGNLGWYGAVEG